MTGNFTVNLGLIIFIIAVMSFIFNPGRNLIVFIISLELLLLSIGIVSLVWSFQFDDLLGANITLFILPIAGAESAVSLAYLVAFAPVRGTIILK